jgi:hypothetical protein
MKIIAAIKVVSPKGIKIPFGMLNELIKERILEDVDIRDTDFVTVSEDRIGTAIYVRDSMDPNLPYNKYLV